MFETRRSFEDDIRDALIGADLTFEVEANAAGYRVDFLVRAANGAPLAALELAAPTPDRAADSLRVKLLIAMMVERTLQGPPVLVVIPDNLIVLVDERRVVRLSKLVARLRGLGAHGFAQAAALIQPPGAETVFASMPFADEYVDTLKAIRYAAKRCGLVVNRVDHDKSAEDVVRRIKDGIRSARLVVVDVSESRPSVLHEYGFAEAIPRPLIAICSTDLSKLPFNVRNNCTEPYVRGNVVPVRRFLLKAIRAELGKTN